MTEAFKNCFFASPDGDAATPSQKAEKLLSCALASLSGSDLRLFLQDSAGLFRRKLEESKTERLALLHGKG